VPAGGPVNRAPPPAPGADADPAAPPDARHARMALACLLEHKGFLAWAAERAPGACGGPGPYVRPLKLQCALNLYGLYFALHALALDPGQRPLGAAAALLRGRIAGGQPAFAHLGCMLPHLFPRSLAARLPDACVPSRPRRPPRRPRADGALPRQQAGEGGAAVVARDPARHRPP
jgi:hypothetical protein